MVKPFEPPDYDDGPVDTFVPSSVFTDDLLNSLTDAPILDGAILVEVYGPKFAEIWEMTAAQINSGKLHESLPEELQAYLSYLTMAILNNAPIMPSLQDHTSFAILVSWAFLVEMRRARSKPGPASHRESPPDSPF